MELSLAEPDGFQIESGMSKQFCLCGGETETTKFYIIPTIIGEIDIQATVSKSTETASYFSYLPQLIQVTGYFSFSIADNSNFLFR